MIKQQLIAAQIVAMKAKDSEKLQTIRYILSQIKNIEIDKRIELSDEDVVQVMRKEVKKLQDSIASFISGGREDLAAEYRAQIAVIAEYLPAQITDEDLKKKIQEVIDANREMYEKNKNALIGICVQKLKSIADSSRIASLLRNMS